MNFHRPSSVEEVVALLVADRDARCLAGGATLVAMLNAQLVKPSALISLSDISALKGIVRDADGSVWIGAMTSHRALAETDTLTGGQAVVREAAKAIGHPAIRNMGTIGGSICNADSTADYPAALVAAAATIEIAGPSAQRAVAADRFFLGHCQTALTQGEIVVAIRVPPSPPGAIGVYERFARLERDAATVSVALVLAMNGETCTHIRLALGACGPVPIRVEAAEARLRDSSLDDRALADASKLLLARCHPVDDLRATAEYRLMLVPPLVCRAVGRARAQLERR